MGSEGGLDFLERTDAVVGYDDPISHAAHKESRMTMLTIQVAQQVPKEAAVLIAFVCRNGVRVFFGVAGRNTCLKKMGAGQNLLEQRTSWKVVRYEAWHPWSSTFPMRSTSLPR